MDKGGKVMNETEELEAIAEAIEREGPEAPLAYGELLAGLDLLEAQLGSAIERARCQKVYIENLDRRNVYLLDRCEGLSARYNYARIAALVFFIGMVIIALAARR